MANELVEFILVLENNFIPVLITKDQIPIVATEMTKLIKEKKDSADFFSISALSGPVVYKMSALHGFYFRTFNGSQALELQKEAVALLKKTVEGDLPGEEWKKKE